MTVPEIEAFWVEACRHAGLDPVSGDGTSFPVPVAQSFGATAEQADELIDLIVSGVKTGTTTPLRDYEIEGEHLPRVGDLMIVLDGLGRPRALIRTTDVRVVRFDQVTEEHARAEGEGDRTLAHWRAVHEWFFKEYDNYLRGFSSAMPIVCERFEVLVPTEADRAAAGHHPSE